MTLETLPVEQVSAVDEICDAVEAEWLSGAEPAIESFVQLEGEARIVLIEELIRIDLDMRKNRRLGVDEETYLPLLDERRSLWRRTGAGQSKPQAQPLPTGRSLLVLDGFCQGQRLDLAAGVEYIIGRWPHADLSLYRDRFCSSRHATAEWLAGRCLLRDNGSRNGVWVAGKKCAFAFLDPGDVVTLGRTSLRLV